MRPLFGLVLAGGRSRRMGRPKESFAYHEEPEAERVFRMLESLTAETFYSIRVDQASNPMFATVPRIIDRIAECGPLGVLWTAFRAKPDVSWLVVPVDMPFLQPVDLERLIAAREPEAGIVGYSGGKAGYLPLPAIYEAELSDATMEIVGTGKRAIMALSDYTKVNVVPAVDPRHLMNVNTIREKERVLEALHE